MYGRQGCANALRAGSASRARIVDRGCNSFTSRRSVKVLKATKGQSISTQISINVVSERPEEAVGVYCTGGVFHPCKKGQIHPCKDELWSNGRHFN